MFYSPYFFENMILYIFIFGVKMETSILSQEEVENDMAHLENILAQLKHINNMTLGERTCRHYIKIWE